MITKLVVAAVLVIAAVAVADGVRSDPEEPPVGASPAQTSPAEPTVVRGSSGPYRADGGYLKSRVLFAGRPHLSEEQIAQAFPAVVAAYDLFDIRALALAPDGTLVVGVYEFPAGRPARAAIELWRGRELVGAFGVLPGALAGGLGFSGDGSLIAAFSADGQEAMLFDREGRFVSRVPL